MSVVIGSSHARREDVDGGTKVASLTADHSAKHRLGSSNGFIGLCQQMDFLNAYGLLAVTLMLVTYAFEGRSTWFTLAFAGSCVLGSSYGFLQGAWPFGLVEAVWSLVAVRKWWIVRSG